MCLLLGVVVCLSPSHLCMCSYPCLTINSIVFFSHLLSYNIFLWPWFSCICMFICCHVPCLVSSCSAGSILHLWVCLFLCLSYCEAPNWLHTCMSVYGLVCFFLIAWFLCVCPWVFLLFCVYVFACLPNCLQVSSGILFPSIAISVSSVHCFASSLSQALLFECFGACGYFD